METPSRRLIAEKAGVSKTTVTRVLAGFSSVSEETRNRVLAVIDEFGYTQNKLAGNLVRNLNSNFVAMLVPDMTNYYYLEMFDRMVSILENLEYTVSIYKVSESNLKRMVDKIVENRASVIINLAFTPLDEADLKKIQSANIKIVHPGISEDPVKIKSDYLPAMKEAFDSLIDAGCKKIYFLCGTGRRFLEDGRLQVFLSLMRERGIDGESRIVWGNYPEESAINEGYRLMLEMVRDIPDLDAVFCLNDMMALGAIKAVREAGKKVGKDVSVIGFDNIKLGEFSIPSLSTIDSNIELEAQFYVDYILGKKGKDPETQSVYIPRASTR